MSDVTLFDSGSAPNWIAHPRHQASAGASPGHSLVAAAKVDAGVRD